MSGSVRPFTGANPADMVMLYSTWNVKHEIRPDDQVGPVPILGQPRHLQGAQHDEQIETERGEHAEEPLLLSEHRIDEIAVRLRQEPELALRAVAEALAGQAAGADRNPGLDLLVAGAAAVLLGIEEGLDALLLIRLERERPADRRADHGDEGEDRQQLQPETGDEGDAEQDRQERHRGAEVRLLVDQQEGDAGDAAGDGQIRVVLGAAVVLGEIGRQGQRQRDLHELGRLQVERRRGRSSAARRPGSSRRPARRSAARRRPGR